MAVDDEITAETTVALLESVISAEVGDEIVMLHLEKNMYYDTNVVGAAVWRALSTPTSVRAICALLAERYAVDLATCEADVLAFVREAHAEGLIRAIPQD